MTNDSGRKEEDNDVEVDEEEEDADVEAAVSANNGICFFEYGNACTKGCTNLLSKTMQNDL